MDFNPFNLPGPEFLIFFILLAGIVIYIVRRLLIAFKRTKRAPTFSSSHLDNYDIAYLKSGSDHTLKVAILELISRKLLEVNGTEVKTIDPSGGEKVRWNLEKVILRKCKKQEQASTLFTDADVLEEVNIIRDRLRNMGLITNDKEKQNMGRIMLLGVCILWVVAAIKIYVAISRHHHNIYLLVGSVLLATWLLFRYNTDITAQGIDKLTELKNDFDRLHITRREQQRTFQDTHEMTLAAALFGFAVLPTEMVPQIFRSKTSSADGGVGNSSSCSGGSCGGGCGGGCGGCS